jgi:hypothetical protein
MEVHIDFVVRSLKALEMRRGIPVVGQMSTVSPRLKAVKRSSDPDVLLPRSGCTDAVLDNEALDPVSPQVEGTLPSLPRIRGVAVIEVSAESLGLKGFLTGVDDLPLHVIRMRSVRTQIEPEPDMLWH